jgi:hypothetical protein
MRYQRQNTPWLIVMGLMVLLALTAGIAPLAPLFQVGVVGALLVAVVGSFRGGGIRRIQPRTVQRAAQSPLILMRTSPAAREAGERARRRGDLTLTGISMLDIGLITSASTPEGMVMRRSRSVSLDDDGVRPYLTINVAPEAAERQAMLRFEIIDHNGETQYVHEMKTYLRDGDMNLLADMHLPLSGNSRLTGAGDWDLRVGMDGATLGMLSFTASPSIRERARKLRGEDAADRLQTVDEVADSPVSLNDLMQSSKRRG